MTQIIATTIDGMSTNETRDECGVGDESGGVLEHVDEPSQLGVRQVMTKFQQSGLYS